MLLSDPLCMYRGWLCCFERSRFLRAQGSIKGLLTASAHYSQDGRAGDGPLWSCQIGC